MEQLNIFRHPFDGIPDTAGIYGFFFDLSAFHKILKAKKKYPSKNTNALITLRKAVNAMLLSKPSPVSIDLYGKSKCNMLNLESDHVIDIDFERILESDDTFELFSSIMAHCTLLNKPIYIGITVEQSLSERFSAHKRQFELLKKGGNVVDQEHLTSPKGKLYHKLLRRDLEFRDLVFACISVDSGDQKQALPLAETFLQALANPPLSVSN